MEAPLLYSSLTQINAATTPAVAQGGEARLDVNRVRTIGPPVMELTAAPYGGARFAVEVRMDDRTLGKC